MNISEFATRSGVSADTLRYYEKIGVLRQTARNASGKLVSAGGRVLNVIGTGPTLTDARDAAYAVERDEEYKAQAP